MTSLTQRRLLSPILALALLTAARANLVPSAPDEDAAYTTGTRAMNESRWSDAVLAFDQVIKSHAKRADAALYWKAYSLSKLGKRDLAGATCGQLGAQFTQSSWNGDCRALLLSNQIAEASTRAYNIPPIPPIPPIPSFPGSSSAHSKDPDTDLKILAINSLLNRDPAQAVPLLRNILSSNQPHEFKRQALFVLSQKHSPEADALMHDLLTAKMGPDLQRQAIQAAGVFSGRHSNDLLAEIYQSSPDGGVKREIVNAFFISGDDVHMVALARSEKNVDLRRQIVSQLALMQGKAATDYMMELLK